MFNEIRNEKLGAKVLEFMNQEISLATEMIVCLSNGTTYSHEPPNIQNSRLLKAIYSFQQQYQEQQKEQLLENWINSSLTDFIHLLGQESASDHEYYNSVLSRIVTHLKACQGALFIFNEDVDALEMMACYAKEGTSCQKTIQKGEGLIGQCFLRSESIMLTQVPEDYTHISSGLGKAYPNTLLILPIKNESGTAGVIELSCFSTLENHKLLFLQKLSEHLCHVVQRENAKGKIEKLLIASHQTQEQILKREREIQAAFDQLHREHSNQIDEIERNAAELKKQKEQLLHALSVDNILIDVAGRNRMLSQKICFLAEMIVAGKIQYMEQLEKTITLHHESLTCIKIGGIPPEVSSLLPFAAADDFLLPTIEMVEKIWLPFRIAAEKLLQPDLSNEEKQVCIQYIEEYGLDLLKINNELVLRCIEFNRNKLLTSGLMRS